MFTLLATSVNPAGINKRRRAVSIETADVARVIDGK